MDWEALGFVQDTAEDAPVVVAGRQLTGWETVVFELGDAERPRALEELRAAIEAAEKLIERWRL
jgi:hypothetical protein